MIDIRRMIFAAIGLVVLTTGCQTTNQQYGAVGGAVAGGLLSNTIGKGKGNTIATAVGAVFGTIAGSEVGRSMDQPRTVAHAIIRPHNPTMAFVLGLPTRVGCHPVRKGSQPDGLRNKADWNGMQTREVMRGRERTRPSKLKTKT
jgi:hypothetical protein